MVELTVTELRSRLLDVIRRVEADGEEVLVVRHGRRAARIVPVAIPPQQVLGADRGRVRVVDPDDDLLSTGEVWEHE